MDESNDSSLNYDYINPTLNISKGSNTEKWSSILSLLKNGSHSEQVMALTELSNLLSYSNEEFLLGFPSLAYIRVLFHILENPSVKYSKLFGKNEEKSCESQNMSMKFQLPYFHILSSVYKDEKFFLDNFSKDKLFRATDTQIPSDSKPPEYEGGMDLDEEEEIEPDTQVLTNKMILSASCLHTILDIIPYTSRYFSINGNLTTLCSKLNDLEYIDLAERILLIFEKLSQEIPLSLLKKSVMYHMLQYIDFFPIEIQTSTLSCVFNLVKLVDSKAYFSEFVIPILTSLCSFLQNDNKKLSEVVISIWKELLSILSLVGDESLVSNFVEKLTQNSFLEKILRLILSPSMGRTLVLKYMTILSSLLKLSTHMVNEFFKYDQLLNIKLLCSNQKDSFQHLFIHLSNNILCNQTENKTEISEEKKSETSGGEIPGYVEEVEMSDESESKNNKVNKFKTDSDRDEFFCENVEYFAAMFELLPISELCDTCCFLTSDRHKSEVIGVINSILRISNKIERFKMVLQNTLSVSKTTEFVSTCFLQVDLKVKHSFSSLLGILQELINIFGNDVIVTFHRYGIHHYLAQAETDVLSQFYNKNRNLIELIVNTNADSTPTLQANTHTNTNDSDLIFEIRTNMEVWTPYELVKNVPLNRINFVRDEHSLKNFVKTLVSQSYTPTHMKVLWKAFMKILQHANLYSFSNKADTHKILNDQSDNSTTVKSDENQDNQDLTPKSNLENLLLLNVAKKQSIETPSRDTNVQLLGSKEKKSKIGFDGILRKYVDLYSVHPFNLIHSQLKLRLRPFHTSLSSVTNDNASVCVDSSITSCINVNITDKTVLNNNEAKETNDSEKTATKDREDAEKLLPICVYVPCLVRLSKVEHYIKRYIEKKKNVKVAEVFIYMNEVCLGSNSQLYESLCRFGGLPPKKRRNIANQVHLLKYKYTLTTSTTTQNEVISDLNTNNEALSSFSDTLNTVNESINSVNVNSPISTSPGANKALLDEDVTQTTTKQSDSSRVPKEAFDPNIVKKTDGDFGLNVFTLYKGGKYNFKSLLTDFNRFNTQNLSQIFNESDMDDVKMAINTIKDDSTMDNSSRSYNDSTLSYMTEDILDKNEALKNDIPDKEYIDTNTLIERYKNSNAMEDLCMDETNSYFNNVCNQTGFLEYRNLNSKNNQNGYSTEKTECDMKLENYSVNNVEMMRMDSMFNSGHNSIELNNPILYSNIPSFTDGCHDSERFKHIMRLTRYDQERISFILGEKNDFQDVLLESAFPGFPNTLSEDKKILLRVMSILSNLTENLILESGLVNEYNSSQACDEVMESGTDVNETSSGLAVSTSLSLKVLSACSNLANSLCFGCEYWVSFVLTCPQIFSIRSRVMLFKLNTLGLNRNLCEFYYRVRNVTNDVITEPFDEYLYEYVTNSNLALLEEEVKVHKIKLELDRNNLLEDAIKSFETLQNNPKLEIGYKSEVGIGSGPTLEFFTLIAETFINHRDPKLLEYNNGYYYPAPHMLEVSDPEALLRMLVSGNKDTDNGSQNVENECVNELAVKLFRLFSLLGKVCAYALLDDKLFGLFFNPLFWDIVKHPYKPLNLSLERLKLIDPELAESLETVRTHPDPSELHLTHEFQGYELFKGGSNVYVNRDNFEDYVQSVVEFKLFNGVKFQIWAFRYGFSTVLPLYSLWFFSNTELSEEIFGSVKNQKEFWTIEHLKSYIIPDHGYDSNSKTYNNLIQVLHEFDDNNKRLFLKFTTGAPILPRGGFKSLVPLMRVVKKGNVDELPSVMTCTNYLKMPKYNGIDEMKNKLLKAIHEGQNAFNLS